MERKIRLIAGTFILISLGLGWWVSPYWFLFTAFVGVVDALKRHSMERVSILTWKEQ